MSSKTNFEEFVKSRYKDCFFYKGSLFRYTNKEDKAEKISKSYIYIIEFAFLSATSKSIEVRVYFQDFNDSIYYNDLSVKEYIDIEVFPKKRYISSDWNDFMKIIKKTYSKKYKSILLNIYREYFTFYIIHYLTEHPEFLMKCGWIDIHNKKEFLSITYIEEVYPDFVNDLFDGNINNDTRLAELFSNLCNETNTTGNLFGFLLCNPCVLTIFSYSIHAILWNYTRKYYSKKKEIKNSNNFSLCIYGDNPSTSRILANLLTNFFTIKHNKWTSIDKKYHVSTTSLSQENIDNLFFYKSIPIIITSQDNHFKRLSSIIGKIDKDNINIYPVYINDCSILGNEMLNCCSDALELQLKNFNLEKLREQFIGLIYNFINYLSDISDPNTYSENRSRNIIESKYIREHYIQSCSEYMYSNYLDIPLLEELLNENSEKESINISLLKEVLDTYCLKKVYDLECNDYINIKKEFLIKWVDQYLIENPLLQQDNIQNLREMILKEIFFKWNSIINGDFKPYISEEILPDPVLRKIYYSILEKWKFEQNNFISSREKLIGEWLETHFPELWLYKAIDIFCKYLKSTPLKIFADNLKIFAKKCFLPQVQNESSESSQPKLNHLNLLYSFIQESLNDSKNDKWIWEEKEPRGEKESCYYLSYGQGLKNFNEFLSKFCVPALHKREFSQLLKTNKILKMPEGKSNTWKRKGISVYILIQKELDKFRSNN